MTITQHDSYYTNLRGIINKIAGLEEKCMVWLASNVSESQSVSLVNNGLENSMLVLFYPDFLHETIHKQDINVVNLEQYKRFHIQGVQIRLQ